MNVDTDTVGHTDLRLFLAKAEVLKQRLQSMAPEQLQALWMCNSSIAALNVKRLRGMDLLKNLTPAILSYEGLQYQYMVPRVFEYRHFDYVQEHLRIVSGFYGLLRPLDGIVPYRLEMQAKLAVGGHRDLYGYWGTDLARQLGAETGLLVNLASEEYSKAVVPHLTPGPGAPHLPQGPSAPGVPPPDPPVASPQLPDPPVASPPPRSQMRVIDCVFGQFHDGRIVQKGTLCKMARGAMVRFLAEHGITKPDGIKAFDGLGYTYSEDHSGPDTLVFIRTPAVLGAKHRAGGDNFGK